MLHVPIGGQTFGMTTPSWGTTRPAAANGTSVTPAVGSKGSYAQVGSDLTQDCYALIININSNSGSAASRNTVVDIGVDEAGGTSYTVKIADLLAGGSAPYNVGGAGQWFYFPLFIPSGAAIGARAQGTVTTAIRVGMLMLQQPMNPSLFRKGSFVETLGITAPNGTALVPGTTAEGAWTSLGTTTNRLWWWQVGLQVNAADTAWTAAAIHVDVATGDASTKDIIIKDLNFVTSSAEQINNPPLTAGVEWVVPPGSNIYVRAQSSAALDAYTCAVYGCGG